jgi:hypothetical protein
MGVSADAVFGAAITVLDRSDVRAAWPVHD